MIALSNRDVARRFDAAAATFDRISNAYAVRRRAEALARFARGRSLEVGGGTGAVTAALPDRSAAFHSDIAPSMCRVARAKLGRPSLCFDAERIPFADACMDTVIAAEVIYYLQHPDRFLREALRVLRPGGRLLLSSTNPAARWLDRGRALLRRLGLPGMYFDDGGPRFPSPERLRSALRHTGFEIEQVQPLVVVPLAAFDALNRRLERTPAGRLALFYLLVARKPS